MSLLKELQKYPLMICSLDMPIMASVIAKAGFCCKDSFYGKKNC